jgi:hypothetical protein
VTDAPIESVDVFSPPTIVRWKAYRAPQAALLAYHQNLPGDDTAPTAERGDATSLAVYPWSDYRVPRAARLWQGLPADGDAPAAADSPGDATALSVYTFRPWARHDRWPGLLHNTAQDDSVGSFEYGLQSDYIVAHDPTLYSPMSRWLYQTAPAQDETSGDIPGQPGDATSLMVYTFHPGRAPRAALMGLDAHKTAMDNDGELPIGGRRQHLIEEWQAQDTTEID